MTRPVTHLGRLLRCKRREKEWRPVDVVRAAGYRNVNKGMRRYEAVEQGRIVFPRSVILHPFTLALEIDETTVLMAMCRDFEELDRPVSPRVIVRILPGVYMPLDLPENCMLEEAESIASEYSRNTGRTVCIVLSSIRGLYITPDGRKYEAYGLPSSSPLGNWQTIDRVRSLKEVVRLQRDVMRMPMERKS